MSIKSIKVALETYLNANVTTKAIKWFNTSLYTLNGVVLNQTQIDALDEYLAPQIIPISEEREVYSSATPFNYDVFFQISIYTKLNSGTGEVYDTIDTLNTLFKEQNIGGIVVDRTETLANFEVGDYLITPVRFQCHLFAD